MGVGIGGESFSERFVCWVWFGMSMDKGVVDGEFGSVSMLSCLEYHYHHSIQLLII